MVAMNPVPQQMPQFDIPDMGVLNAKGLPEGLNPVYLQAKLYKIKNKSEGDSRIACAISLLGNLKHESDLNLANLKAEKRMGLLHVEKGQIKSLTLSKDEIQMMQDNGVNEIAFKVNNKVLLIKDQMILRVFSPEDYERYIQQLNG